ncbi:MAG: tetratricopeptide repeat protein [Nitrospirota bacterium]|nr:tetratricopeptide repeat protein [Nitrospirota bacterium]
MPRFRQNSRPVASLLAALLLVGCATSGGGRSPAPALSVAPAPPPPVEVSSLAIGLADPEAYYHFIRAYHMDLNRQYDLALSEYLAALTYAPGDRDLLGRTADLYLRNGDVRGAIEAAEKGLEIDPGDAGLLQFLSALYLKEGDFSMAVLTYRRLLEHNPDDTRVRYLLTLAYIREARYDEALVEVEAARKLDPTSGVPDYYVGRIHNVRGDADAAMRAFRKSIHNDPSFEAPYLDLADLLEQAGQTAKARELYETVVARVDSDSTVARDRLIQMDLKDHKLDRVLVHLDAMLASNPNSPSLLYRKAGVLEELNRFDEAIEVLTRVLAMFPSDLRSLDILAGLYERAERYDDARAAYGRILDLDPDFYRAHVHLGYLSDQLGDAAGRDASVAAVAVYMEAHPDDVVPYRFVGWGYMRAKRYDEAIAVLQRALALEADNVDLHYSLGSAYYEAKQPEGVEREMRWVVEHSPTHASALNFLGYFYAERGERLDEAVALIQRALKERPDDGFFLDSLAWAYYQQGKYREALKLQKDAIDKSPQQDAALFDHLGSIHLKLGHPESAREAWTQALELEPDNADLQSRFRDAGFGDPPPPAAAQSPAP